MVGAVIFLDSPFVEFSRELLKTIFTKSSKYELNLYLNMTLAMLKFVLVLERQSMKNPLINCLVFSEMNLLGTWLQAISITMSITIKTRKLEYKDLRVE
jgi:hypothetical protein